MPSFDQLLRTIDDRFSRLQEADRIPGVAWGVVRDGALVHAGGAGTIRDGDTIRPDADTIFRIASMTKSFTATAILILRDEGRLRLDDPVAEHVPQLASWRGPTADAGPVTIRQLLTMSAGMPTDDPWGDRQQALPLDEFAELLAAGPTFAWPPGTWFEYSNLGYGILGRVVTAASGTEYREFVRDRVLRPLGMVSSGYVEEELPEERRAHGYVRRGDALVREGTDGYGALASMGGVSSSVRDLATWVAGFLDAFPARDDPEGGHPLRRASRREMQQMHRSLPGAIEGHVAHLAPVAEAAGYGFGLFLVSNERIGLRVTHGGGYPGFGSNMTWHPSTGLGVVALGNLRYAQLHDAASESLTELVLAGAAPRRRLRMHPSIDGYRGMAEQLLAAWDDDVADASFAMNMDLDQPRDLRREAATTLARELGPFRPAADRPVIADSPAHLAWWLRGERGWVRVSMLVTPEPSPRIQQLAFTRVPDVPASIEAIAERLLGVGTLAAEGDGADAWPEGVVAAPGLEVPVVNRSLRAGAARLGALRLGPPTAGDGATTATFEVRGSAAAGADLRERAPATFALTIEAGSGAVTAAVLRITEREAPVEAW